MTRLHLTQSAYRLMTLGCKKGHHVTRYYMYRHFEQMHAQPRPASLKALSISGSQPLTRLLGFSDSQIVDASYPDCNVLALPFPDESFDAVVSDQVLEHVEGSPAQAIDETIRVLRPGGLLVHATCMLNPIHPAPGDFWRFTPDGLAHLVAGSTSLVEAGGWGNVFIWLFFALGIRYEGIPHNRFHPFHWAATFNQPRLPVTTWVVARKHASPDDKL